ncbi:xylose isomerase [Paenalcaligenes niemegkensis]|uniref:xylose isomerase n=1 Tax=Paenalcaligenes niemegkensis TaxID=2895469 RepID=UPI001EE99087|nr:xylose isomerase [Paenalcaligenes niemegkensis]MCQ9616115.1 xylose isomerase [Paenalcaligenes niemegkensis]
MQQSSLGNPVSLDEISIHEQFRLVKESGVFDYFDRIALRSNIDEYLSAIDTYDLPVHSASWFYKLGQDDQLLMENLQICKEIGARCHNIMTFKHHQDGHELSDGEIVDHYLQVYDQGMKLGVEPSFELHVNMWTEDFLRVSSTADQVQARGVPFNFTLDYSHVVFKMNQPTELALSQVEAAVASGDVILDPFEPDSLCDEWLSKNIVKWTQLRTVAPNQPANLWHKNEDGQFARGIQYPMVKPEPGEWHSPWNAYLLEPSKEAIRKVLRYHITHPESPLAYITTEMINLPDYGLGARYDLFEQNVAAARFIRNAWKEIQALHAAELITA